jgi:hypothetical protein
MELPTVMNGKTCDSSGGKCKRVITEEFELKIKLEKKSIIIPGTTFLHPGIERVMKGRPFDIVDRLVLAGTARMCKNLFLGVYAACERIYRMFC